MEITLEERYLMGIEMERRLDKKKLAREKLDREIRATEYTLAIIRKHEAEQRKGANNAG